ncbi:DNA-processing protein DprA [Candidatus Babeliales bacterium]|nr:DNA-processing protein DprA [Candidatus Babeliales bacterium]
MSIPDQNIILHLSLIDGVGEALLYKLIERLGQERLPEVYNFFVSDFLTLGVPEQIAQNLVQGLKNQKIIDQELALMREHRVGLVTIFCPEYSKLLKEIHVPPVLLYFQGDINLFAHEKNIACVGARKAHRYVHDALTYLIVPMMHDGWVVVSGGAQGADTYAHQIALEQKIPTIVVVGSGLCHVYPPQNKKLFEQVVAAGGLIVSSFSMETKPDPWNFPKRNRLISGLSRGCLVLQAAAKSGALITAESALQQGREVFAVPGSIFDELSAGCHNLIQQGAKLVTCAQDILDELGYPAPAVVVGEKKSQQKIFVQPVQAMPFDDLSNQILQQAVVPITGDLLLSKLQVDVNVLQNKLFELSLDGKIAQDGMGFWKRT